MQDKKSFTKSIRKHGIAPSDGSEPLTVIEFSLTNDVRQALVKELEPFVTNGLQGKDKARLAQVIRDNMPPEVLDELKALSQKNFNSATVYVVKNLPSYADEQIPADIPRNKLKAKSGHYSPLADHMHDHSYATTIATGVALAIGVDPSVPFELFRYADDTSIIADRMHKHQEDVTMLSISKADGSSTRFMDFKTLAEDPQAKKITASSENEAYLPLNKFAHTTVVADEEELMPCTPISGHYDENNRLYREITARHSMDVKTEDSDLVLWSNHGRLWHQARHPEQRIMNSSELTRAAFSVPATIRI